ncbi:M56 family metallopeptidase [bacterium 1xD8-6]|nr:M56 family metallopeptidase [bacterium D16-36]RKI72852.1 M56 family metallopeptidase [bacterium 1xD8-6]
MDLLSMSFSASIIIVVIIVLRTLLINKLPKRILLILWSIALLRLLVPFSFPSSTSVYFLISQNSSIMDKIAGTSIANFLPFDFQLQSDANREDKQKGQGTNENANNTFASTEQNKTQDSSIESQKIQEPESEARIIKEGKSNREYQENTDTLLPKRKGVSIWAMVWIIGMSVCIIIFLVTYILCYRQFRTSLPVENTIIKKWRDSHQIRRTISIRQSDCISAPLSYGFFRPSILMPKTTEWDNSRQLHYILEHEFVHIRRLDTVTKLFFAAAVCIHWFNPIIWIMYIFAGRDIEISCDEAVVRHFGEASKSAYALTLINMEERKSSLMPLGNHFSKNAAEERITAIMKLQKPSALADILAAALVISVASVFATSALPTGRQAADSAADIEGSGIPFSSPFDEGRDISSLWETETNKALQRGNPENLFDALNIDIATKLTDEQQKKLLNRYQKCGLIEKDNILYYQGKPIRLLIDKYQEEIKNKYGGKTVNTIRIYSYFNEKGTVDVNINREYKLDKTEITELLGDNISIAASVPAALNAIIMDLPKKSINKLAQKAAQMGKYSYVKKIIPFADTDTVDEIAEKMTDEGINIDWIAEYTSTDCAENLAKTGYKKWGFSFISCLLPYLPLYSVDELYDMAAKRNDHNTMKEIAAALNGENIT